MPPRPQPAGLYKRGDRSTFVQVHDDRIVAMALTPGVFINAQGSTQLAGASTMALFKCPAKYRACREAIAARQFMARAPVQVFLTHLMVKPLGPLDALTKRLALLPGPMVAIRALKPF